FTPTAAVLQQATAIAEIVAGQTISPEGDLAVLTAERDRRDREVLQEAVDAPGLLTPLVRWLTVHGPDAPANPYAKTTCREAAEILIAQGDEISVREAYYLCPDHPLIHIALAAHERASVREDQPRAKKLVAEQSAKRRREFLRDYDLKRLPADDVLRFRAARL